MFSAVKVLYSCLWQPLFPTSAPLMQPPVRLSNIQYFWECQMPVTPAMSCGNIFGSYVYPVNPQKGFILHSIVPPIDPQRHVRDLQWQGELTLTPGLSPWIVIEDQKALGSSHVTVLLNIFLLRTHEKVGAANTHTYRCNTYRLQIHLSSAKGLHMEQHTTAPAEFSMQPPRPLCTMPSESLGSCEKSVGR